MAPDYDAIIVGARCAGSPTAMLLARKGHRVLLVDRAEFPSDTLSTHIIHPPGVAALHRWGLLARVAATGCPPVERYSFDFGPFTIAGTPRPYEGHAAGYAPRRTVLDKILVDGARQAGVVVREHFNVDELIVEDGVVVGIRGHGEDGVQVTERARVVVGADGRNSHVAKALDTEDYHEKPRLLWSYYTYFSGLPVDGFEVHIRPGRGFAAVATNDGLTMVVCGWPYVEAGTYKADVEAQLPQDVRAGAGVRRAGQGRQARRAVQRRRRAQLLPQAVWARLGARRRRRLQQGPDHGDGHHGRVPGGRAVRHGAGRDAHRRPVVRRRDGRLPAQAGRAGVADVRVHDRPRAARAATAGDSSSCSAPSTATRRRWTTS